MDQLTRFKMKQYFVLPYDTPSAHSPTMQFSPRE